MADYTKLVKSPLAALRDAKTRAYHVSPNDFDQFSLRGVGNSGGHNEQGHGLYFSDNSKSAKKYLDYFKNEYQLFEDVKKDPTTYMVDLQAPRASFLSHNFKLEEQPIGEQLLDLLNAKHDAFSSKMTGADVYKTLGEILGSDIMASSHLRKAGVPGARYFSHEASAPLSGPEDFVVFDPRIIDILKKYCHGGQV